MQFRHALPSIIQVIWEAYMADGPVRIPKLDVTDVYHRDTLRLPQVGAFAYIIPLATDYDDIIICINLVFLVVWVDSPNFFCILLEILTDVVNALIDMALPVPEYGTIGMISDTGPGPKTLVRSSPISTDIWMMSSPQFRARPSDNSESLMALSMPSSGSYHPCLENTSTW